MAASAEHHIAVDFIGNEHHAVVAAYLGHAAQGVGVPLQADGVVGIADYHHGGPLAVNHLYEPVEVHLICAVGVAAEGVVGHASAIALYH